MNLWLIKNPPKRLTWGKFIAVGYYRLYGIRNRQARNYLSAMQLGDLVLYYQSQVEQSIRGIAKVSAAPYPDPSSTDPQWIAIDLEPVETFLQTVTLEQLRGVELLADLPLFRQPRLSVMPLTEQQFQVIRRLAGNIK